LSRVGEAKQLLNNPVLMEAFEMQRAALLVGALKCEPRDDMGRYRLLEAAKVVEAVKSHLTTIIAADEIAQKQAEAEQLERFYDLQAAGRWTDGARAVA
jgi:hypothetical protein